MAEELQANLESLSQQIQRLQVRISEVRWTRPTTENISEPKDALKTNAFDAPDADLVLNSSDGIQFRVFKRILSEGSAFFQTMFTLPSGDSQSNSDVEPPIVSVAEDSQTISNLLHFLYPNPNPNLTTLKQINDLLAAAIKYDMPGVLHAVRHVFQSHSSVHLDPFAAYTIAVRHQLTEEIQIMASRTFSVSLLDMPLTDNHRFITGFEFFQLLRLHRRRAKEFIDIIKASGTTFKCPGCLRRPGDQTTNWWKDWEARACLEIQHRPSTRLAFSPAFIAKSAKVAVEDTVPCRECPLHMHSTQPLLELLKMRLDAIPILL